MAVIEQLITEKYALYCGDCCEVMASLPSESVHLSVYSPPFCGIYRYSSSERDLSNSRSREEFLEHYAFVVREIFRVTLPGRMTAVHCSDIPSGNTGCDHLYDLPGKIIELHESLGFKYARRYCIWKEPLAVRNRTMAKNLAHKSVVEDSADCGNAGADFLLVFRKRGDNPIPITHPNGLTEYAGEGQVPSDLLPFRGWKGKQTENKYSHWIWRRYASSFWDDVRVKRVLPYREAREEEDEKHMHPLQLDVIERALVLWSNPGETVLSPFGGVGSEPYASVQLGRRAIAIELKSSYYRQMVKNMALAETDKQTSVAASEKQPSLFDAAPQAEVA